MARFTPRRKLGPLEPMEWPDGTEQPVKRITWAEQEILADMEAGAITPRDAMPLVMPVLLPGKSWDEIRTTLDADLMREVVAYASGQYEEAMKRMEEALGNAPGATAPASPPETPSTTSSPASPASTAAPCGAS